MDLKNDGNGWHPESGPAVKYIFAISLIYEWVRVSLYTQLTNYLNYKLEIYNTTKITKANFPLKMGNRGRSLFSTENTIKCSTTIFTGWGNNRIFL